MHGYASSLYLFPCFETFSAKDDEPRKHGYALPFKMIPVFGFSTLATRLRCAKKISRVETSR